MYNAIPDHVLRWANSGTTTISSITQWSNDINNILSYNSNRISTARNHLNQELGLQGQNNVTLDVFPPQSGSINISTITPLTYPWSGIYFDGCPIGISAIADSGFTFSHWDYNSLIGTQTNEKNLYLNINQNIEFVANFIACNELINVSINEENNALHATTLGVSGHQVYEWYSNGVLLSNDSTILNPNSGTYLVIVTDTNGCQTIAEYIFESTEFNISVFPNPSKGNFNISFTITESQNINLSIVNSLGQIIYEENHIDFVGQYNNNINLENQAKSMYLIKIKGDQINYVTRIALQ